MIAPLPELHLLIVSDDESAREMLARAAQDSARFATIATTDDGSALTKALLPSANGAVPNVLIVDAQSLGRRAGCLVADWRSLPETRRSFVAVLAAGDFASPRADFCDATAIGAPSTAQVVALIGLRANAALQPQHAA